MIDFNKEQKMIQNSIREMVKKEVEPRSADIDEKEEYPEDLVTLCDEMGLYELVVPEEYGGSNASMSTLCMVIEEISKASPSLASTIFCTNSCLLIFVNSATKTQKKVFFDKYYSRKNKIIAFAMTEPDSGSDAASLQTFASSNGDNYIVNGNKIFITCAPVAQYFLLMARTKEGNDAKGISAFMIEKDAPGFSIGTNEHKMGLRGSPIAELVFNNAQIPKTSLLGREGEGWVILRNYGNLMRLWGAASMALGIAESAIDRAADYAKKRKQFGKPIAAFQGIQFMLADMEIQTKAARSLIYSVARMHESGKYSMSDIESHVAMAKCFAADTAMKVTTDAVQIFGGYGYMRSYPIERMMRDAKGVQIFDGSSQIQKLIVSRSLIGKL